MIRILIITDDFSEWADNICQEVRESSKKIIHRGQCLIQSNSLFYFDIRQNINENSRGQRYNLIIIDKAISKELIDKILVPTINPSGLVYTGKGRFLNEY